MSRLTWKKIIQRGAAATLPVVLILGGIILEITAVSSFIAYSISRSGLGERAGVEAISTARSGVQDAIRKLVRNKDFYNSGGYNLTVGTRVANITVSKDVPSVGITRIESTSTVLLRQRKMRADIQIDSITGEVDIISFEEVTN